MSPKVPEAYLEARRTEILEAAGSCFLEKGFHNTTMQDIYDATGLSPGAVYNYFSSKEDIVVAAIGEFSEWSVSSLEEVIAEHPEDSLQSIVQHWIHSVKHDGLGAGINVQLDFYSEASRNGAIREAVLKSQDVIHIELIKVIKQNQRSGIINAGLDPLAIARTIMGIFFGMMIHKSLDPEVDLDTYGQVFQAIFNGTLCNQPAQSENKD